MAETAVETTLVRRFGEVDAPAQGTWALDPAHTVAAFSARHMMVTKVRGRFERLSGEILVGDRPEDSRVDVTIDAASITTDNTQRDEHLRSPDFLDVERYPSITFRSTSVEQTGPTSLTITGDLTIKDVTKPVVLAAQYEGIEKAPWGSTVAGFSARAEIDREAWGMTWNQALETGGVLVGKKVVLEIEAEATPPR
jgi:polyisoprenoid-binding protein YceI